MGVKLPGRWLGGASLMWGVVRFGCRQRARETFKPISECPVHEVLTACQLVHASGQGLQRTVQMSCKILELRPVDRTTFWWTDTLSHLEQGKREADVHGYGKPKAHEENWNGEVDVHDDSFVRRQIGASDGPSASR